MKLSRKDGGFIKTQRIAYIKKRIIQQSPNKINIKNLITWIEGSIGLSKRRAREYIEVAISGLDIVKDENEEYLEFFTVETPTDP